MVDFYCLKHSPPMPPTGLCRSGAVFFLSYFSLLPFPCFEPQFTAPSFFYLIRGSECRFSPGRFCLCTLSFFKNTVSFTSKIDPLLEDGIPHLVFVVLSFPVFLRFPSVPICFFPFFPSLAQWARNSFLPLFGFGLSFRHCRHFLHDPPEGCERSTISARGLQIPLALPL